MTSSRMPLGMSIQSIHLCLLSMFISLYCLIELWFQLFHLVMVWVSKVPGSIHTVSIDPHPVSARASELNPPWALSLINVISTPHKYPKPFKRVRDTSTYEA